MNESMEERAERLALYIIENRATVRTAAQRFGVSKSTVHKDDGVIIGTVKGNAKKHWFWRSPSLFGVETDSIL